jgi:hypothetical protein
VPGELSKSGQVCVSSQHDQTPQPIGRKEQSLIITPAWDGSRFSRLILGAHSAQLKRTHVRLAAPNGAKRNGDAAQPQHVRMITRKVMRDLGAKRIFRLIIVVRAAEYARRKTL